MIHITTSYMPYSKTCCGVKLGLKGHTYYSSVEWIEIEDETDENLLCPECNRIWGCIDHILTDAINRKHNV